MEDPCTSASRISTECPALSSAAARLTATVLLPTPPLPLTTAIMRVLDSSRKAGASSEVLAVFVGHNAEVDLDAPDALDHHEPVPDIRGDPVLQWAARGSEGDADRDVRTLYLDAPDHVQRDEVAPDLGVPHIPERLPDTSLGEPVGRLTFIGSMLHELFGRELRRPANIVRWPGLTPAKPVNHVCQPPPAPRTGDPDSN
jgi:hypothetical protein